MEFDTKPFDWAYDTFVVLNNNGGLNPSPTKWAAFSNPQASLPAPAFSIPPSLLTQASIERYGQVTPPEDLSPAELRRDSFREDSILAEQLQNEPLWPNDRSMQALQNHQSQQPDSQQQSQQDSPDRTSKHRRTSKPAPAN